VSMSTRRWSERSADTKSDTGNGSSFTIKMSKTSGIAEETYELVVGVRSKDQTVLVVIITQEFRPSHVQAQVTIHVLGVEVAGNLPHFLSSFIFLNAAP
jgi:uncharacterized protein YfdQ (DUF2303 family)